HLATFQVVDGSLAVAHHRQPRAVRLKGQPVYPLAKPERGLAEALQGERARCLPSPTAGRAGGAAYLGVLELLDARRSVVEGVVECVAHEDAGMAEPFLHDVVGRHRVQFYEGFDGCLESWVPVLDVAVRVPLEATRIAGDRSRRLAQRFAAPLVRGL